MLSFVKNNFLTFVVLVLVAILLLERCDAPKPPEAPKIIRDTVWIHNDTTVYTKPQIIKTIPVDVNHDYVYTQFLPDTNYSKLVKQYNELVNRFLEKNVYRDSSRVDTNGYVITTDTVSQNRILGRNYRFSLKYPIIKETIIQPAPKVNQWYIGGMLQGNRRAALNQINVGLLLKNKKDQIFGVSAGINTDGDVNYGIQSFWKIKLR